jgi:hypothetical protein
VGETPGKKGTYVMPKEPQKSLEGDGFVHSRNLTGAPHRTRCSSVCCADSLLEGASFILLFDNKEEGPCAASI